jgi:hypothetical protein
VQGFVGIGGVGVLDQPRRVTGGCVHPAHYATLMRPTRAD